MKKKKILIPVLIAAALLLALAVGGYAANTILGANTVFKNAIRLLDENYTYIHSVFGDRLPEKDAHIARTEEIYDRVHPVWVPFWIGNRFDMRGDSGGEFVFKTRRLYFLAFKSQMRLRSPDDELSRSILHELKHADDQQPLWEAAGSNGSDATKIFGEGASAFWENYPSSKWFVNSVMKDVSEHSDRSVVITSGNEQYGLYQYQYVLFLTLTDYDTIHRFTESGGNAQIIKNKIRENYGSGVEVDLFWDLSETNAVIPIEQNLYEQANIFLNDCLLQDVNRIKDKQAAFQMLDLYRFLKAQILPRCYEAQKAYCTYDHIDMRSFESALFEKVRSCGLLDPLTADEAQQRFIFDCLLYMPEDDFDVMGYELGERYYSLDFLPISLSAVQLAFDARTKTLQLIDLDAGEPIAQYEAGGDYFTIDIESESIDPIEPITGTQLAF